MSRRDLPTRTRTQLTAVTRSLEPAGNRVTVLGGGLALAIGLHAVAGDARLAWLSAPLVLLGGLGASVRVALLIGGAAAVGHGAVDLLVVDVRAGEVPGVAVRTAVLPFLALVGTVGADLERQRHHAMERVVSEDPVTGLLNVRVFYEDLAARREAGEPFAILLADLRGMRDLNERYGHPTGTEAMRVLAHVLRRAAGEEALLARLGSDEIAVAFEGDDRERCQAVVDAAVQRLASERVLLPDGGDYAVHASYGIAAYPEDGPDEVAVLRVADRAKEQAKAGGLDPVGIAGRNGAVDVHGGEEDPGGHA